MPTTTTHRERVLRAVSLQEPDRVPMDLGSHLNSSIHKIAYENLKNHMGLLTGCPMTLKSKMMQDVMVDDEILDALDIDVRGVYCGGPDDAGPGEQPDGTWIDEWGVIRAKPEKGYYYDVIPPAPLAGDITISDIVNYPWPNPDDPGITRELKRQVKHWRSTTDCALVLNLHSPFVHQTQYLRGFEDWYTDLAGNTKIAQALFDACMEVRMGYARNILREVGSDVDIVVTADDMGTQQSLQFSPRTYRQLFKPRQARYFDLIRSMTDASLLFHSCGSVYPILNDLIEIGVQILNPVQTRAADMDPVTLKREFGDRLAFWGGIDIQQVLPFGSPDDVRADVTHLFETLGAGGGWVLCPSHDIQPEVPPGNIVTLYKDSPAITRYK